jgi:hypothetical protein
MYKNGLYKIKLNGLGDIIEVRRGGGQVKMSFLKGNKNKIQ